MSLRLRIAALCEPIDTTLSPELFSVAEQAARAFVLMVPLTKKELFLQEKPIPQNGTSVVLLEDVVVNGRIAREADNREIRLLSNRNSIYRATAYDPVYHRRLDLVIVPGLEANGEAYAYAVVLPTFVYGAPPINYDAITAFPDIPSEAQHLATSLTAAYWMMYRAGKSNQDVNTLLASSGQDLLDFITNFPTYSPPDEPTLIDFSTDTLDLSSIAFSKTALGTLATYTPLTPPTITTLDLDGITEPELPELPTLDLTGLAAPEPFSPATIDLDSIVAPSVPTLPTLDMTGLPDPTAPEMATLDLSDLTEPTSPTLGDLDQDGYTKPTMGTTTKPTIPGVTYSAPSEPTFGTVDGGTPPTWVSPGTPPDISAQLTAISDMYERIDRFIGKITTVATPPAVSATTPNPSGAFWLADEDEEMVAAAVQLASISLQIAKSYYENTASLAQIYDSSVKASVGKIQGEVQAYTATIQGQVAELQAQISTYQARIAAAKDALEAGAIQARVLLEEYQADSSFNINKFRADVEAWQIELRNELDAWSTQVRTLVEKYSVEVQAYNTTVRSRIDPYVATEQVKLDIYRTDAQVLQSIVSSRVEPYAVEARSLVDLYSAQVQGYLAEIRAILDPYQVSEQVKLGIYQTEAQVYATLLRAKVDPYVAETQALVSSYQSQVQAYGTLIGARIQPWTTQNQLALQQYQVVVEAGITEWRTRVETALRQFEVENNVDLQATRIEVERLTSEFQLNLQAKIASNQNLLEEYKITSEVRTTEFQAGAAKAAAYLQRVQVGTEQAQILLAQVRSQLEFAMVLRNRFAEEFKMWATSGQALFERPQQEQQ
jgi:hypothetical protein